MAVACSSDATSPSASGGAGGSNGGSSGSPATGGANAGDPNAIVGTFIVELEAATATDAAYTAVSGKVYDGATPATVVWDSLGSGAGCELQKQHAPFCSTACVSGTVCIDGDVCAPYPTAQDLGPVLVKGLGTSDITMKAIANSYQLPGDVTLPYPPASEGAAFSVNVAGGAFGAFSVQSKMVVPLLASGTLTLESDKPLQLSWQAPGDPSLSRMQIKVDIAHHGGGTGKIECDVADTGSLEIPAALVTGLIDLGVAGFPTVTLSRIATGSTAIAPGKVTLQALSSVPLELVVPGVQSCHEDAECPAGKACRKEDLTCER